MTAFSHHYLWQPKVWLGAGILGLAMLACTLSPIKEPRTVYITETPVPVTATRLVLTTPSAPLPPTIQTIATIPATSIAMPAAYTDATYLLDDVCFDALLPIIGNYFMLDSQAALDQFWGTLNVATVCGHRARQPTYDFAEQVVVGTVRLVQGCTANFIPEMIQQNDLGQQVVIPLRFEVNANCDYQLMVSFVVGIPRPPSGYTVTLDIQTE